MHIRHASPQESGAQASVSYTVIDTVGKKNLRRNGVH